MALYSRCRSRSRNLVWSLSSTWAGARGATRAEDEARGHIEVGEGGVGQAGEGVVRSPGIGPEVLGWRYGGGARG
eukprot:282159-Prymnesium_polylepis.1